MELAIVGEGEGEGDKGGGGGGGGEGDGGARGGIRLAVGGDGVAGWRRTAVVSSETERGSPAAKVERAAPATRRERQ